MSGNIKKAYSIKESFKWVKKQDYKIILAIIFFFVFLNASKNSIAFDMNKVEKIITLIWTIQGLTLTLFVFLYYIQIKIEQERKLDIESLDILVKITKGINLVENHNKGIKDNLFDIILMSIGLIFAISITSKYAVEMENGTLISNSFRTYLIFTFYLSTNSCWNGWNSY